MSACVVCGVIEGSVDAHVEWRDAATVALPDALEAHGTFVAMNNVVSQSVPHLHAHVVPRRRKDGLRGFFWPREKYADDAEVQWYATRVREALDRA